VLRKTFGQFAVRTIMQPLLLVFVFTYVFPKIGQGIGGSRQGEAAFSTLLMAGVIATSMVFQGVQAVALPLVQEFGFTREIEDRVMAPMPVWAVALEKILSGSIQGLLAGLVVFPLAAFIPATPVHLDFRWFYLLTLTPIAAVLGAAMGLTMGTRVDPRQVPLLFSIVILPMRWPIPRPRRPRCSRRRARRSCSRTCSRTRCPAGAFTRSASRVWAPIPKSRC